MRVIIAGGTGFIGRALSRVLVEDGFEVSVLTRGAKKTASRGVERVHWDGRSSDGWADHVEGAYAVVNLAGENVGNGRWNNQKKRDLLESRINAVTAIVETIRQAKKRPRVFLQGSAIGYYGRSDDTPLDEESPSGVGLLAEVARRTEEATLAAAELGVRRIVVRTGVVLERDGGALPRLLMPYKFLAGGYPGSGKQWISWIHLLDEVHAIAFLLKNEGLEGAFNLASPNPVPMADFCRHLGRAIGRPTWLRFPASIIRLVFGEMADEVLLSGQRVLPKRLLEAGYEFRHPELSSALDEIFSTGRKH